MKQNKLLLQFALLDLGHDGTLCEAFLNANQPQTLAAFQGFC